MAQYCPWIKTTCVNAAFWRQLQTAFTPFRAGQVERCINNYLLPLFTSISGSEHLPLSAQWLSEKALFDLWLAAKKLTSRAAR